MSGKKRNTTIVIASEVLDFIIQYKKDFDRSPTRREILDALHLSSTSVVCYYLKELVIEGKIEIDPKISRGLKIINSSSRRIEIWFCPDPACEYYSSSKMLKCPQHPTALLVSMLYREMPA